MVEPNGRLRMQVRRLQASEDSAVTQLEFAVEAIRQFAELNEWQAAERLAAIPEAAAGDLAGQQRAVARTLYLAL